ncbi:serpin family protein [Lentisphaerota bacterium WC36G]|nr:serpin family protein [Lentisphaerae bacterium WC36]
MKKLYFVFLGLLLISVCDAGMSNTKKKSKKENKIFFRKPLVTQSSKASYDAVKAMNLFSLKILKLCTDNEPDKYAENLIISPQLTFMNLSKFYIGSAGKTRYELGKVMGFDSDNEQLLKGINYAQYLLYKSAQKSNVYLKFADSLWVDKNVKIAKDFQNIIKNYLCTEYYKEDFSDKNKLCKKINKWTSLRTYKMIKNIISPESLLDDLRLVSINTAFFKGLWTNKFNHAMTVKRNFYVNKDTTIKVPMMRQKEEFFYRENESYQFVSLPFRGEEFAMNLILPKENCSMKEIIKSLTIKDLNEPLSYKDLCNVSLSLPRFEISHFVDNKPMLEKLGVSDAFNVNKADFSQMSPNRGLCIAKIYQKAFIRVNEYGAKATAADLIGADDFGGAEKKVTFNANRPFLFFIVHKDTNLILFTGYVLQP